MPNLELIEPDWPAPNNVRAYVSTRLGGQSSAPYASLNCGDHLGDDPNHVAANRDQLRLELGLTRSPAWLNQVHGTEVVRLNSELASVPTADASITFVPGVICCVMTADCLPILLTTRAGDEVAAVHAGWRGLAAGVIEKCLAEFSSPAQDIIAWAGPAISVAHFEVGEEVRQQLGGSDDCWRAGESEGKLYADLFELAGERLKRLGVHWYGHQNLCTYADSKRFFSHRRDGQTGRLASLIYMSDNA